MKVCNKESCKDCPYATGDCGMQCDDCGYYPKIDELGCCKTCNAMNNLAREVSDLVFDKINKAKKALGNR